MFCPMNFVFSLCLVVRSVSAQSDLHMLAQFRLLLYQILARAYQVAVLFLFRIGYADKSKQAIGVEFRQLRKFTDSAKCLIP